MNAIIALCHFCEGHGPQVMFCTQPTHPKEQTELSHEEAAALLSNRVRSPSGDSPVSSKSEHTCEGCYSVKTGFVSHDNDAPISYISSKYPNPTQPEIYSLVRNACLRSLSGEACSYKESHGAFARDMTTATEDSIIDMEKQEETEEGFIKLFTKPANEVSDGDTTPSAEEKEIADIDTPPSELDSIHNLRLLLKVLGEGNFHLLTHHVVIGNQVIIRGSYKETIKLILHALMILVPKGCCRPILHSTDYQESFRCNFLGLTADSSLPSHILTSEMFVLLVEMHLKDENDKPLNDNDFDKFEYSMASPTRLLEKAPTVLQKIEHALKNEKFSNGVMEQCLICLKEEVDEVRDRNYSIRLRMSCMKNSK
ncbi:folliculin [Mytilus galloprovincialis]|uniref:Folliculin n=1 Tax=Mytilus galloprovincialis TaxID=29158 RepID=A0A8B6HCA0_MYTGA|nr:folliculin [Mytilus galloprovincialis]